MRGIVQVLTVDAMAGFQKRFQPDRRSLCVSICLSEAAQCPLNGEPTNLSGVRPLSINEHPCSSDVRPPLSRDGKLY